MNEKCISCEEEFRNGNQYYPDLDGGCICIECAGDGPFVNLDTGEALQYKPKPLVWSD